MIEAQVKIVKKTKKLNIMIEENPKKITDQCQNQNLVRIILNLQIKLTKKKI